MNLKIKLNHPQAQLPVYGSKGAACFDLFAAEVVESQNLNAPFTHLYDTGLQVEIPEGHVMMIYSRSGHGFKQGITLANGTGVIDSDYRGNIMVKLVADYIFTGKEGYNKPEFPKAGERIAQAMIIPVEKVEFEVSDELSKTERGEGGFGSTGNGEVAREVAQESVQESENEQQQEVSEESVLEQNPATQVSEDVLTEPESSENNAGFEVANEQDPTPANH